MAATSWVLMSVAGVATAAAAWSIRPAPAPAGATDSVLVGVSCTSGDSCVAVGGPDDQPGAMFAEAWDGSRWTLQRTAPPPRSTQSLLTGVSCLSAQSCMAVGFAIGQAGAASAVATRWDGSRWRPLAAARPPGSLQTVLNAVSCPSEADCTAVGDYQARSGMWFALTERWAGSRWSIERTPHLQYSELAGVSCASARMCTAVGAYANTGELVEHWNGRRWWRDRSAEVVQGESELTAVSCPAVTVCTAVGGLVIPSLVTWPVLESWSGVHWAEDPMPAQPPAMAYGVSCASRTACTAVGSDATVEQLRGGRWRIEHAPDPEHANLYGVSCLAGTCVAVGSWINRSDHEVPLVESATRPR